MPPTPHVQGGEPATGYAVGVRMWPLLIAFGCHAPIPPTVPDGALALPGTPRWPERTATLAPLDLTAPPTFGVRKVAIDPGHGTGENTGAATVACGYEADAMLELGLDLADRLRETGHFEVLLTRETAVGPSYKARAAAADAWGAEALISLHLDARGAAWSWETPQGACRRNDDVPGYAVLVADKGEAPLLNQRVGLARALSAAMSATGFGVYHGLDYGGLYDRDPMPGVYLDRRVLFMLRRPTMPSVILETHHGLDYEEHTRWAEPRTREAFAAAVAAGLIQALSEAH